jgi:hypothetical protein
MLGLEYSGAVELRYVAGKLRKAAVKDLRTELARAQKRTYAPLQREIVAQAIVSLPHTGGYAGVMARSVKVSIRANLNRRELVAVVYARSRRQLRDVAAVNRGVLRHPVYGRRRNPWTVTAVPPGFVDRPAARLPSRLVRESLDALDAVIAEIVR